MIIDLPGGVKANPRSGVISRTDGESFRVTGQQMLLLSRLAKADADHPATKAELLEAIYGDGKDQPLYAETSVMVQLHNLRKTLSKLGVIVCNAYQYGWWLK